MIINKTVKMRWNGRNKKHYTDLDYTFTKLGDEFEILVSDLTNGSEIKIDIKCDGCGVLMNVIYGDYYRRNNNGKYYCKSCGTRRGKNIEFYNRVINNETISFKNWCIENNRNDILERWDYKLNSILPEEISYASNKRCYFKCPKEKHNSEPKNIGNITGSIDRKIECSKCHVLAEVLIERFGDNAIELYWGDKNEISPWDISRGLTNKKVYLKCQTVGYHQEYDVTPNNITQGRGGCPYCDSRRIHPLDSFAQHNINKYGEDFLDRFWDYEKNIELGIDPYQISPQTDKKFYVICQKHDYHGSYLLDGSSFEAGYRCGYCGCRQVHEIDSLATIFPQSLNVWSRANKKSPMEYSPYSSKHVWWKCDKHGEFKRSIIVATNCEFRCPECTRERTESLIQEKTRLYLSNELGYKLNHERSCSIVPINSETGFGMPFDNEVIDLKLIVEVHGAQHYNLSAYTNSWRDKTLTPEECLHKRKTYDEFKKNVALDNGYQYLELPHWTFRKSESYKKLIDNKIFEILSSSVVMKEVKYG